MVILIIIVAAFALGIVAEILNKDKKPITSTKIEKGSAQKSVEYFEECRRKATLNTETGKSSTDVSVQIKAKGISKEEREYWLTKNQTESKTKDPNEKISIKGKLENFLNEADVQTQAILNLKKGMELNLVKFGSSKIKVTTASGLSIGFVDIENAEIFLMMGLHDIKCTVRRITKGKTGNAYAHLYYNLNKVAYEKAAMSVEMRTSPMPKEYFDAIENGLPLGKRNWSNARQGEHNYFYRPSFKGIGLYKSAEIAIKDHIRKRRFKVLPDESQLIDNTNFGYEISDLKGLNHRSWQAQEAAYNLKENDIVVVVPDWENDYHDAAHAVFTLSGELIGYLDRRDADYLADHAQEIVESSIFMTSEKISIAINYLKSK